MNFIVSKVTDVVEAEKVSPFLVYRISLFLSSVFRKGGKRTDFLSRTVHCADIYILQLS